MTSCMPTMWLHPLHTRGVGIQPELLLPGDLEELGAFVPSEGLVAGLTLLTEFAASWTGSRHIDAESTHKVVLGEADMYISMHTEGAATIVPMQVPLLSACVGYAEASGASAAALLPSSPVHQGKSIIFVMPSLDDNSDMIPRAIGPFWLLVVDAAEDGLQGILTTMSQCGALRWDLDQAFTLTSKQLGAGACSVVYLAHEKLVPKRCVAAKVLSTQKSAPNDIREASFLVSVGWHPHIVSFYGTFFDETVDNASLSWTMILGWCPRGDLYDELRRRGTFSEEDAAEVVHGLLSALACVHSAGIVHRDVKPENILLSEHGRPVLSDFGIAAHLNDQQAMSQRCGSPGYAAPELLLAKSTYSEKVDVFAVGVVLYFLLSCMLPFWGPDVATTLRRTVKGIVPFDRPPFGNVTRQMKQLVADYLNINQDRRPSALLASKLLVLAVPTLRCTKGPESAYGVPKITDAAASPSSARDGCSSRRSSQTLTVPCTSTPTPAAPPSASAPVAGWKDRVPFSKQKSPIDDSATCSEHHSELPHKRLQPEHPEQPVKPGQPEQPLLRKRNRHRTVATDVMRRLDRLVNEGDPSQPQRQQQQWPSSSPSSGQANRVERYMFAKHDPTNPGDVGNSGDDGGYPPFTRMSTSRQPVRFHAGEDASTFSTLPQELTTPSEAASSCSMTTGSDVWKSWKSEGAEQLGMSTMPSKRSSTRRHSRRQSRVSTASSTATSAAAQKGHATDVSISADSADGAEGNPSFEPLAHLLEEDGSKADFGEFRTSKGNTARQPPPQPRPQPHRQPQIRQLQPQPPEQPRRWSISSVAGQAHHVEGQPVWKRYMPRFLSTPRQWRAASHP